MGAGSQVTDSVETNGAEAVTETTELAVAEVPSNASWAVLFVRTGSEGRVVEMLAERLDYREYLPFVPMKEYPYVKVGKVQKKEVLPCFPGYVFIKVYGSIEGFYRDVFRFALSMKQVYKFLCYGGNQNDIFMRADERSYIEVLLRNGTFIDGSLGLKVGDDIRIISGALAGLESCIKKINRSKRTAIVELPMMGETRTLTLMLEIMEKM